MEFNFIEELKRAPIAHRGYFNEVYPENSLGAMQRAVDNNFSIELDIQLTKDNKVVVFHDNDLKRMCGVDKMVKELTYDEIKELSLLDTNATVPLFSEVLDIVAGKVFLVVELKSVSGTQEKLVDLAIEMLNKYEGKFVVQSFDPRLVKQFRTKAPNYIRGQLVSDMKGDTNYSKLVSFLVKNIYTNVLSKPHFVNTHYDHYPRRIKAWHKKHTTICYTVRDEKLYPEMLKKYDAVIFEGFDPTPYFNK